MHEYEIFIEEINPCGGEKHSKKTLIEAEAASPEAYVKENGRYPVLETTGNENGDVVIVWSYVKKKYKLNVTNFPFFCNC